MEGTAVRGRLTWQTGKVSSVADETPTTRTIMLDLAGWAGHRAGQHLDVRLTAEDGYSAERSYSIASAPGEPVAITVQRIEDGEVSPYLTEELRAGDELEVRGPIGGYFVWDGGPSPVLLVAGGSGVVPLRAILRHRERTGSPAPMTLLYSVRTLPDVIYRAELDGYPDARVLYTLTREHPAEWAGLTGRVDQAMLGSLAFPSEQRPTAFVCGPTPFVEAVAESLVALGYPARQVKTERFGPTGDANG
ncbi:MAG TPA: ferredoxin reductase [Streptosporangiaceae bacterium]|nr:ferredoxin reductase [Streptosporangiaceae bacterium]